MAGRKLLTDLKNITGETVRTVSSVLSSGGLVVYPSDTVYGLMARADDEKACGKIAEIKGYKTPRPFIVLVSDLEAAKSLTNQINCCNYMHRYWPGPVTLLLRASPQVEPWLIGEGGTVAVRVPGDKLSNEILKAVAVPLVSTSANLKGGINPMSVSQIPSSIVSSADIVLDGGMLPASDPSAILDLTSGEPVRIR